MVREGFLSELAEARQTSVGEVVREEGFWRGQRKARLNAYPKAPGVISEREMVVSVVNDSVVHIGGKIVGLLERRQAMLKNQQGGSS